MRKFKVGDKVKCIDDAYKDTLILTVSHIESDEDGNSKYDLLGFTEDGHVRGEWCAYHFELVKEKEEMQFDMKTQPWFIRVNNEQEFEAAISWAEEKDLKWDKIPREYNKSIKAIGTCLSFPKVQVVYCLGHDDFMKGIGKKSNSLSKQLSIL